MIVHCHDYGWGPQWPIKKIEQAITDQYLAPLVRSDVKTVLINSTWYGQEQHDRTMGWLRDNAWDIAIVISMIDAAIPDPSWFSELQQPVIAIGSYSGQHHLSLWAEVAARYIQPFGEHEIDTPFMCLNRKPHWHRRRLYEQMSAAHLLDQGFVSLGGSIGSPPERTLLETVNGNDLAPNGAGHHHGIVNDITSLGNLALWRRHFINIVTETVYDVDADYFVSEKIFKPILGSRPFLVYAPNGAERWLRDQNFDPYLDDFRDVTALDLRDPKNIVPFLNVLCDQGPDYWCHKYIDLLPKIQYNQQRFREFVTEQRQRIKQGITCQI